MPLTLGFDIYGTLIDTNGVIAALEKLIGDQAPGFARLWRDKQLEYTFRRSVMGRYRDFTVCTRDALEYSRQSFGCSFTDVQQQTLLNSYATLPAFADVAASLEAIRAANHRLYAFSNGPAAAVETVLTHAGILDYFMGVVSVDEVGVFKPAAKTYDHFLTTTGADRDSGWLISSNGFDIIGAVASGMRAAWLRRAPTAIFDPWEEFSPTIVIDNLTELPHAIHDYTSR